MTMNPEVPYLDGKGDRIGLFLPNVPHYLAAYFGALRLGATVERHSRILDVSTKSGRSGALVFVTVDLSLWRTGVALVAMLVLLWRLARHLRALLARMRLDKKNIAGRLRLVLWRGIGQAEVVPDVDEAAVLDVLRG